MGIFVRKEEVAASPDIGPLVHRVYSVRTTSYIQNNERGVCNQDVSPLVVPAPPPPHPFSWCFAPKTFHLHILIR